MKIKTADLIGPALDWAVAKAEGKRVEVLTNGEVHDADLMDMEVDGSTRVNPSTDWAQGGPIIEREGIQLHVNEGKSEWLASRWGLMIPIYGPTPLIAAMRCYCCATLGDEIEIPQELQPCQQQNL